MAMEMSLNLLRQSNARAFLVVMIGQCCLLPWYLNVLAAFLLQWGKIFVIEAMGICNPFLFILLIALHVFGSHDMELSPA